MEILNDLNLRVCNDGTKKTIKGQYNKLKKYETREQFFVQIKNTSRPQQQEATSSGDETDRGFVEVEVKEPVLLGYAKHKVTAEETNIEECTP